MAVGWKNNQDWLFHCRPNNQDSTRKTGEMRRMWVFQWRKNSQDWLFHSIL
jgi:hypothetical protein